MKIVPHIIEQLLEAKSHKHHVKMPIRIFIDQKIQSFIDMPGEITRTLDLYDITDTDSLVEHIESMFRRVYNNQVLFPYVPWIIFSIGVDRMPLHQVVEHTAFRRLAEILMKYDSLKRRGLLTSKEWEKIDNFISINDVQRVVDSTYDPQNDKIYFKSGEAKEIHRDSQIRVINVKSPEAVRHFSSGTRGRSNPWCISNSSHWNRYKKDGYDWYIILTRDEKFAVDFEKEHGWDHHNNAMSSPDILALINKYPVLRRLFPESGHIQKFLSLLSPENPTEDTIEDIVHFVVRKDNSLINAVSNEKAIEKILWRMPELVLKMKYPESNHYIMAANAMHHRLGYTLSDLEYEKFINKIRSKRPDKKVLDSLKPVPINNRNIKSQKSLIKVHPHLIKNIEDPKTVIRILADRKIWSAYLSDYVIESPTSDADAVIFAIGCYIVNYGGYAEASPDDIRKRRETKVKKFMRIIDEVTPAYWRWLTPNIEKEIQYIDEILRDKDLPQSTRSLQETRREHLVTVLKVHEMVKPETSTHSSENSCDWKKSQVSIVSLRLK